MPNDPRVKFKKKKIYDSSRNVIYFGGEGSGGMRSIFEDGTPPPDLPDLPDPGGGGTGGGGGVTPREIPVIPQPLKPGLNPGEITGITIGSIAAAAAAAELTRRALEDERTQRRRGGEQPVSQDDRPLSSRQSGGKIFERQSRVRVSRAITRGINRAIQSSFEMVTPSSTYRPVSTQPSQAHLSALPSEEIPEIRAAMDTPMLSPENYEARESSRRILNMALEDRAAIESAGGVGIGSGTRAETELSRQGLADRLDAIRQTQFDRAERIAQESVALENRLMARQAERNRNYSESLINLTPEERARLENTSLFDINDPNNIADMTDAQFEAFMERNGISYKKTRGDVSPDIDRWNYLEGRIEDIDLKLMDRQLPIARREQLIAEQKELKSTLAFEQEVHERWRKAEELKAATEKINIAQETPASKTGRRISKTIAPETPIANNPINDRITAAQPTREVEMQSTGAHEQRLQTAVESMAEVKTRGPTIFEQTRTAIQKMTTRKPIEAKVKIDPIPKPPKQPTQTAATKAALERARAASGLSTDVEMRPTVQAPPISEAEALERAIKQSTLEAGLGYSGGEGATSSKGITAETLRAEQPTGAGGVQEVPRVGKGKGKAFAPLETIERPQPQPGGELLAALQEIGVMARDAPPLQPQEPAPRPARPPPEELMGEELVDVAGLTFRDRPVDRFNDMYDRLTETFRAYYSDSIPSAPEGMSEIEGKKYIMDQILKEQAANGDPILSGDTKQVELSLEEALNKVKIAYEKTDPSIQSKQLLENIERTSEGLKPARNRKLTKKTGLLATEEQRLRPTALAGEAQARVQARAAASAEVRATAPVETARAPMAETARAAAPEMSARAAAAPEISARTAPAPEIAARRRMGVPELTAPPPVAPEERASFAERRAFFEETSKVAPPAGEAAPSAPPSAPGSETATPREGAVVERTPAERAAFAEEVRLGLSKKPARQKAKLNVGKTNNNTPNPLDIFVNAQFRNAPNLEIHPGAKSFRGALSELSARVPRLVPTRQVLLNAGGNLAAEGGGMVAGFYAGSAAGKAMSDYFATHPPKNRGEEYGQALATSMVALGVGNLTAKVVTYVIKQGVRAALMGEVSGSISSAGAAGTSAILEAALFATVATTTQFYTTKALEDAGYNHETSRGLGSAAATEALLGLEFVAFMAKGGPLNPFAFGSFVASELFILGFGIWSYFEETEAGRLEDIEEQANREAVAAEQAAARVERQNAIDKINRTNSLRAGFMVAMETHDYDFDKVYATLTDEDKVAMGISTPESRSAFQRQVESAFDPFGSFAEPSPGIVAPEVLSPIEQQRRDVFNSYINWYINDLRGVEQPPFNFNDPKVQELNEYSGGTWQSAAAVTATTNHMQAERVHPLIVNAQNEIINAFHNERKTIEEMPPEVVRYANLDSNFRNSYEAYIVTEAQAQILIEFNRTQYTYNDVDPKLLEIADRDPNFRAAADAYYRTLANQARDLNLSISEVARLNSLMEAEQAVEIGKLNDARNLIIERNQAQNQAAIDAYNANIIREINMYGDNFEAIIRNINDQSLLSGHTFLYASNKADLYRQLHLEMPELELVDPVDEIDKPDATFHPGKGRKVGDTALYGYRYNLTDEQNQELEDMITRREIRREDAERQAALIRERDRFIYEETDQERADSLNMSLEDYYAKYGIPIDPYTMPIVDFKLNGKPPENGRVRMPDGSIRTYRNGFLVDTTPATIIETPAGTYNPALPQQPDGEIRMPDGSIRTYKDGKVTFVVYNTSTPGNERLSPDEINAQIDATRGPTYEQLQQQYPLTYNNLLKKHANDPDKDSIIEATLKRAYDAGFDEVAAWANKGDDTIDTGDNAGPTPVTPPQPVSTILFNGERTMPDGTTRTYKAGKVTSIGYPEGTPPSQMLDKKGLANLNKQEGLYYDPNPPTVTPTEPTEPLKNGVVNMPDGSQRTYQNGLVIFVQYGNTNVRQKTPKEINEEEGIQNATYTGPTVTPTTPVAPTAPLQQGAIKMPDGSKRIYIDGKVVSVAYPEGMTGPTINEINAREGTKTAEPPSITNTNPMTAVDDLFKGKTQRPTPAPAPSAATTTPPPEEEVVLGSRLDSLMGNNPAPAPAPAPTTTTTN